MPNEKHWTEENSDAFAHRIAFDFIAQIENRMESMPIKQAELAKKLQVSEGAVSKLLNNPQNLTVRTIARYSRALGIKASIIAYDDGDADNQYGPINPTVFATCWERAGRPADLWGFDNAPAQITTANTGYTINININIMNIYCTVAQQGTQVYNWDYSSFPMAAACMVSTTKQLDAPR
jgi:transcriptional regulator with XRE-family HTH domain